MNNYAISTSEAATALQASASALQTAGNNMDEALALITAGNAVVQDATKVGAGMRTIALRLTGTKTAKEELEEMGEETENVITTQSKLRDTIKQATAVASNGFKGFDILDENGNYKSTYEIMLGIADVYDEIAETDKQFGRNNLNLLLESVAGKNRANIAASIFQNPELLRKAYASSEEANGSAMRENDKYVQSISGHLAQLTNAWQEMWANAANRDVINFFIDAAKTLVNFANAVGVLPTTLTLLLPYINLITKVKSENKKGIITQFLDWANGLNEAQKAAKAMKEAQEGLNATQEAGIAINTAKAASTKAETEANIEGTAASAGKTVANEGETVSTLELTGAEVGETIAEKGSTAADIEGTAASAGKTAANIAEAGSEAASAAGGFGQLGAAIGGKFAAGIGRITGAVSGLVGAIGIIPTVLGVATGAVLIGKKIYDAHRESVLADAKAATENIKTQQDAIAQQIESYKQLKQQLDSGDLSEQETITVKQQIYDIQKQITEEYGGAARGVDLINSKLEEQVALLNSISQKEALSLYNKNYKGFGIAIDEYTKNRKYGFSLSSGSKVIQDALSEAGLNVYGSGSGTFMAQVKDDAEGSIKSLEKARANLEKLQSEYKNTDTAKIIDNEIKKIDKAISDAYEDADEYRDEALKGLQLKLLSKDQEGYDIYQNYQSSVSNLENAYASGDTKKINEARKAFDEVTKAKDNFFKIKGNEQFTLLFDKIDTSLIDTKNKFRDTVELLKDIPQPDSEEGLFETEYTKRIDKNTKAKKKNEKETDKVHKAAEKLYKLNPDKVDIKATLDNNTYASGKYADALNTLMNEMGWTTAEADEMIDALVTAGIVHGDASDIAYIATDSYNVFSSSVENAVAALNSLNTALSESAKGTGLTEQTLTELRNAFGDNLDSVLEKTANGYHLNTEGAYLLRQQQEALVSADYASAIYGQYQALDKLQEGYNRAKEAGEDTSGFVQQRKAIQDNIDKLNEQLMTFNNANSAYQAWLAKQSSEGEREMYNSIYSGYDAVKDELDRGWAGEKTRSWLDLIFNDENDDGFDAWISSAEEVREKFKEVTKDIEGTGGYSIADFFTVDKNGKSTSLGVWNFFDAIENKQKEVGKEFIKIGKDGEKIFDFTKNGDYQIADLLGMDIESVHAVLRAAADAGFEVHLDQPLFSLEQLTEKAITAKKALEETSGTKLKINLDPQSEDEVDSAMQKLTDYQQVLSEDTSIDPKVKTEKLQQLADIMNFLAAKKREFVEGKVFDIKLLDSKELEKSKKDINDITNKLSNYSKTSGKTEFSDQFTIDPMLLNDVDYLQSKMDTLKEIQPNVDDTQVQYLDQLLAQLQYRINILNDSNIGETVTVDQLMAAEQIVGDINTKLDYAAQHKDIEFNWDADEEFKEDLNTIANLPENIKQKWGLEPNATGEELLELAKKGELHINVETTGNVPKKEDFQPSTPQKGSTITNTKIEEVKYSVSGAMDTTIFDQGKQHVEQGVAELNQQTAEPNAGLNNDTFIEKQNDSFVALEELDRYDATPNVTLTGLGGVVSVAESMKSSISSIKGKTVDVVVNATSNGLASLRERVQGAINKINELKNKKVDFANGTAHAYGTAFVRGSVISGSAFANGNWGTSKDQTALTGELGTEIVVFPDGHWQTVGDTGAEFVHLPKGSIVFNHKQSEELLENGYVTSNKGRGKLVGFASGTAFSEGTDKGAIKPVVSSKGMGGSTTSNNNNNKGNNGNRDKTKHKSNNNNTNKEANKTKNTLDEVEILIARIERQIANLDKTISNTYKTWSTRNNAIKSDLAKVSKEIKEQNKAYTTYMKKANSIQIATTKNSDGSTKSAKDRQKQSATWKKRIQNGEQIIRDVNNQDIWDKIQEYKQWYEKALAAKDAVIDLKEKEGELYKQRFDNEQTYYEELIGDLEHTKNLLESYNDTLSESGKLGSQLLIRNQIAKENENIRLLNKEYNSLIARRNEAVKSGKIKKYSEAWYEMEQSIQEVSESIAEAQNNVITLGNNIRQLDWDRWDKIHDAIGGVNNELEFLYDLFNSDDFFDEQGNLTDQGVAGFALLAQQYDTYFRQAQEHQKEIEATEKVLKNDPNNQDLVDKLKELKEAQQDAISSAKKMKESMVDLTEDGIKKQIDYVKDLIEDYEDLLETQKDQIDYAKKIADQQKELNKLEKQYRAIQNDTSEESAAKRQKLRDQINEKRDEVQESQDDRRLSETKDMLSDFEESFEQFLENKLKDVEGIVQQVIDRTNANGTIIKEAIDNLAGSYGYTLSNTLSSILTDSLNENNTLSGSINEALTNLSTNLVSYFNGAFDNENVRTIASGVDEIVRYYKEAQNKSEEKAGTLLQEQMRQKVKETGTHMQTYTDINGNTRTGFFNDNGTQDTKHSGWVEKDGKQYLFTNGTIEKKNQWYTGANGKKYYLDQNGARATGVRTVDGKTYFFGSNGVKDDNKKGWATSGNNKYYFKNGRAVTGWHTIDKKKYYFNENGVAYKGLKTIKGKNYYFDSNGIMYTGWRTISNKRYYFGADGAAYTGWKTIDKKRYYFDANGAAYKGLKTIGNKKYYFDSNGVLLKGTWRKISNKQYYLDKKDGHVLTGKQTIDGKKYTFNSDGTLKKNGWKKGTASIPKTGMAWTNEGYKAEAIIRKSDGAILTPLNKGDSVIPSNAMKNMYQALTDPEKYLKQYTTPDVRIIQGNGSTNNQSPTINMQFIANGVQDPNKFVNELMNNKKLEKWIQEVTLGQANGHNSFRKYSYAIR